MTTNELATALFTAAVFTPLAIALLVVLFSDDSNHNGE